MNKNVVVLDQNEIKMVSGGFVCNCLRPDGSIVIVEVQDIFGVVRREPYQPRYVTENGREVPVDNPQRCFKACGGVDESANTTQTVGAITEVGIPVNLVFLGDVASITK